MALFNKLFSSDAEPYRLKGRWYKITFDSAHNILSSDLPGVVFGSDNYITVCHTSDMIIADDKLAVDFIDNPSTSVFNRRVRITLAGTYQIETPNPAIFTSGTLYVYGWKK